MTILRRISARMRPSYTAQKLEVLRAAYDEARERYENAPKGLREETHAALMRANQRLLRANLDATQP